MGRPTLLVVAAVLALTSIASAAPTRIAQQGRLLDSSGQPLTGTHALFFALYDTDTGGAAQWSEYHSVPVDNGYYTVTLGTLATLDDDLFDGTTLWLELAIDGISLTPRQEIHAVPYAGRATTAQNVDGGTVDALQLLVGGTVVVDASGNWVGPTPQVNWDQLGSLPADLQDGDQDTLLDLNCLTEDIARWDGFTWICDVDADTQLTEAEVDAFVANNGYS
ncbi:MAG TPA: hypothetical protein DIU15_04210, partial [Deltaproteobacteria bacterium]|nr:hypothetical protein [Deltaproteobacteria bacterium]